ncbi:hypothetical protein MMC14_010496 [Varicellaria rhodocarpa]|nr:hypothetical protein [Varicellaria rhodocarpa]
MAEKLSEALDSLIPIVLRAQEYAVLFSSHSGSSTAGVFLKLQENLTHLYAEVLNFLVRATIFFNRRTIRRYISADFSPFDTQFKAILDRIGKLESSVGKDVALLNSEGKAYIHYTSIGRLTTSLLTKTTYNSWRDKIKDDECVRSEQKVFDLYSSLDIFYKVVQELGDEVRDNEDSPYVQDEVGYDTTTDDNYSGCNTNSSDSMWLEEDLESVRRKLHTAFPEEDTKINTDNDLEDNISYNDNLTDAKRKIANVLKALSTQ